MFKFHIAWLKTLLHKPSKFAYLKRYSIFKELSSFELYMLNNYFHARSFKAGEMLFDKDYPLEVIYFVEKGEISVTGNAHPSGHSSVKKHQFLGLLDMFHENIRSSSAIAMGDLETIAISRHDLMDLIKQNPRMGIKILTGICHFYSNYIFTICKPVE